MIGDEMPEHGLTGTELRVLRERLGLTTAEMSCIFGVVERTIVRKVRAGTRLTAAELDRACRLARIADLATEMIGDEYKATAWLRTANAYLGGETPVNMLDTAVGADLVVESLYAIAYGGVA